MGSRDRSQDTVLRKVSRKGPNTGDSKGSHTVSRTRQGHHPPQAAHTTHILLMVTPVNDGASAHKEARLKERVRHNVKESDAVCPYPNGQKHKPELTNGGVGQNLLDIVLRDGEYVLGPNKCYVQHPAIKRRQQVENVIRKYSQSFGLLPSARKKRPSVQQGVATRKRD